MTIKEERKKEKEKWIRGEREKEIKNWSNKMDSKGRQNVNNARLAYDIRHNYLYCQPWKK